MTKVTIYSGLRALSPEVLAAEDVGLVTLDLDKVLSEHKALEVYPEAREFVAGLLAHGITPIIATNERNPVRIKTIRDAFGDITIMYAGLNGMRGKPFPDMLIAARNLVPDGKAVHVDDQLKAMVCARLAGFDEFFWVYPRGNPFRQNPGVFLGRIIELPLVAFVWLANLLTGKRKR